MKAASNIVIFIWENWRSRFDSAFCGPLDIAVIEATAVMEDGGIVPTTSVGASATLVAEAKQVIVELNGAQPPGDDRYPRHLQSGTSHHGGFPCRLPILLSGLAVSPFPVIPPKLSRSVRPRCLTKTRPLAPVNDTSKRMAVHLIDFMNRRIRGRMYEHIPPLQSGVGGIANAVMQGILESDWTDLMLWSEVIQDAILDLIDAGKLTFASATSLALSPEGLRRFYEHINLYREKIVLRPPGDQQQRRNCHPSGCCGDEYGD